MKQTRTEKAAELRPCYQGTCSCDEHGYQCIARQLSFREAMGIGPDHSGHHLDAALMANGFYGE